MTEKPTLKCDLCGDQPETVFLHAHCHLTAPLQVSIENGEVVCRCYVPTCNREIVRLALAGQPTAINRQLLAACRAILSTADSASETGHTGAECVAGNWDVLEPTLRAAIAATEEGP